MWITQQAVRQTAGTASAESGAVTVNGENLAVLSSGERRNVALCVAGGLIWRPRMNAEVVLLSLDGDQRRPCMMGTLTECPTDLEPGEIRLQTDEASLTLRNNGDIELVGQLKTLTEEETE